MILQDPRQQHGGVWMAVLVDWENENYKDKMQKRMIFHLLAFLYLFFDLTRFGWAWMDL